MPTWLDFWLRRKSLTLKARQARHDGDRWQSQSGFCYKKEGGKIRQTSCKQVEGARKWGEGKRTEPIEAAFQKWRQAWSSGDRKGAVKALAEHFATLSKGQMKDLAARFMTRVGGKKGEMAQRLAEKALGIKKKPPLLKPQIVTACGEHTTKANTDVVPEGLRKFLVSPDGSTHQLEGAAKAIAALDSVGGFLLADGPGAGKTRQMLAVAKTYAERGKKVIMIAPAGIIKPDWKNGTVQGSVGKDGAAMGVDIKLNKGAAIAPGEVHVSTYEQLGSLKNHIDKDTIVIFDESHGLKNSESARAQHGRAVAEQAGGVVYGTATPADQPVDLAYLFRTELFGSQPFAQVKKQFNADSVGAVTALQNTQAMFDRLTQMGVMVKREVSLTGVQARFEKVELPPEAHAELAALEQGANASAKAQMLMKQRFLQEKHKIPATVNAVQEELKEGRQVVVFVAGVSSGEEGGQGTAAMLREALAKSGIPPEMIGELHGGEGGDASNVGAFQDGRVKVLIITAQSGGTGHNLDDTTGDNPRTQIVMTAPFSAIDNAQMWGRTHRLTTRSRSRMRYLFADTKVDKWNADLIQSKVASLGAIVAGEVGKQAIPNLFQSKEQL